MRNDYLIKKLYLSFLIVSILSALTATVGILIDNIIVGMYLGEVSLGAMGIVGPVSLVFSAIGNICSGGGAARAAQALGKDDREGLYRIFTVAVLFAVVGGLVITCLGLLFTPQFAELLGAKGELLEPSIQYLRGYFLGALPTIMLTALSGFVKIDGSPRLPLICIIVMSLANISLDLLMIHVFHLGMLGMALATTISYVLAVLVACTHFWKKYSTLRLVKPKKLIGEWLEMVVTGAPTAISRICDTLKVMVLNHMMVLFVGVGAVTALNVRTQAHSFSMAFSIGIAQASVPLTGLFYGEEDTTALKDTLKVTLKIGLFINGILAVLLFLAAPFFVGLMGVSDPVTKQMAVNAVRLFAIGVPFALINYIFMSFYQSTKKIAMATMICVLQSLAYVLLISVLLIGTLQENGVWIAFLGAEVLTIFTTLVAITYHCRKFPTKIMDAMLIEEGFGSREEDRLEISVGNDMEELVNISAGIHKFGRGRNISPKLLQELSLCIEEIGGNVIHHAFCPGEKKWFDIMILDKEDSLIVRLRDNGAAFNPMNCNDNYDVQKEKYGLQIIRGMASDMKYKRTLELNNIIITFKK